MTMTALTGTRLRDRRMALGLRQADLAGRAGISASYLNLIEHNRRRIAPDLLARLAGVLGMPVASLEEGAGAAIVEDLRAAAADFAGQGAEMDRVDDFAARFPGWAGLLGALHQRGRGLSRAVEALNDRLSHDPHLSAALHDMLSVVSSVRSTAAILAETPDIEPDWRDRFLRNLNADTERLAQSAGGLVAFLDGSDTKDASAVVSPQEEVEAWMAARGWVLDALETSQGRDEVGAEIEGLSSPSAREMAMGFVARAAADAALMPQAELVAAVTALGPDPAQLARRFGCGVMAVFRRLAFLPGADIGLVLCDASGTITLQKPMQGFALPRYGAACPLWPLFSALSRPMTPVEAHVEAVGNRRLRVLAYGEVHYPLGFSGPELREAAMLILPPLPQTPAMPPPVKVGPTCRICPRAGCPARREPSILSVEA